VQACCDISLCGFAAACAANGEFDFAWTIYEFCLEELGEAWSFERGEPFLEHYLETSENATSSRPVPAENEALGRNMFWQKRLRAGYELTNRPNSGGHPLEESLGCCRGEN